MEITLDNWQQVCDQINNSDGRIGQVIVMEDGRTFAAIIGGNSYSGSTAIVRSIASNANLEPIPSPLRSALRSRGLL